jgi:hypothetical protein
LTQRPKFLGIASHQKRFGPDDDVARPHPSLLSDGQQRTHQVLIRSHAARYPVQNNSHRLTIHEISPSHDLIFTRANQFSETNLQGRGVGFNQKTRQKRTNPLFSLAPSGSNRKRANREIGDPRRAFSSLGPTDKTWLKAYDSFEEAKKGNGLPRF